VGELWEWNLDFDPGMGLPNGYGEPCTDCAYLTSAANRHVRGSQFEDAENTLLSTHRMPAAPEKRYGRVGIRCARAP
jgi:formylglycine-generating enzyme required for sulfatase activity